MKLKTFAAAAGLLAWGVALGCAGKTAQLQMKDGTGAAREVVFPKGGVFGGVSQEQVGTLAQMVADSNTAASQQMAEIGQTAGKTAAATGRIEEAANQILNGEKRLEDVTRSIDGTTRRIDETSQKSLDLDAKTYDGTQAILQIVEKVSKTQGSGEITIFFPVASSRIEQGALQYTRLVNFLDYIGRESKGRKIMLVSVGSASAFGPPALNRKLAKERAEAPLAIVKQYLVNTPHEYLRIYGTGDANSPKGVAKAEHKNYQAVRLIAFFEKSQEPALPASEEPERLSHR